MIIKKHIPNAITCCNLLCGCLAIIQALHGNLYMAALLVGLAAIFDFFDGFAARLLKVSSPIGKDLDSLADMVTFGVVPGFVMYQLIEKSIFYYSDSLFQNPIPIFFNYIKYAAFFIPLFSAVRLAKFNNDLRQSESFIGVPTPANSILICSLPFLIENNHQFDFLFNPIVLGSVSIILSLMLIAELPLFALKFKHFKWKGNEIRFIFLATCLTSIAIFKIAGIPLIIILYVLLSLVYNKIYK